jgi:Ca2+-binding EF-hand superfamily protein
MAVALAIMMGGGLASTIQRAFTTYDINADNQLDREEIYHLIRAVTHRSERECLDIVSHLFSLYDADGDGFFSLNEFQVRTCL